MPTFHLGPIGEAHVERLFSVLELSSAFEPVLARSPNPQALDELRRRVAAETGGVKLWEPDGTILERARKLATTLAPDERPVIWLQQQRFDEPRLAQHLPRPIREDRALDVDPRRAGRALPDRHQPGTGPHVGGGHAA
ncbi:MAG: hypothetical protein GY856_52425 [bacterium]|nr:hypothetical protein [bacterium]